MHLRTLAIQRQFKWNRIAEENEVGIDARDCCYRVFRSPAPHATPTVSPPVRCSAWAAASRT